MNQTIKAILIGAAFALPGPIIGKAFSLDVIPVKNEQPAKYGKISKQEVFWMYTMKTRFWDDGTRITVFYQDFNSVAHKEFVTDVLGVTLDRFATNVDTYINKGNAGYFVQVNSENELAYRVGKIDGAIGYLSRDKVMVNRGGAIAILKIEG